MHILACRNVAPILEATRIHLWMVIPGRTSDAKVRLLNPAPRQAAQAWLRDSGLLGLRVLTLDHKLPDSELLMEDLRFRVWIIAKHEAAV